MGLSWQQGPVGRSPNGEFLVSGMPDRVLCAAPLRRQMRAELGRRTVVRSDSFADLERPSRQPMGAARARLRRSHQQPVYRGPGEATTTMMRGRDDRFARVGPRDPR